MIDLRVTADTPSELHTSLLAILAGHSGQPATEPNPTPAATRASRGKKDKETGSSDQSSSDTSADSQGSSQSASSDTTPTAATSNTSDTTAQSTASNGATQSSEPVTRDSISNKAMTLAQKAGPSALAELWSEFGVAKFSEIGEDKYVALNVRLDELLQPAA